MLLAPVLRHLRSSPLHHHLVRFHSYATCKFSTTTTTTTTPVAIFWDLDNKPPNSIPPSTAAARLRSAASVFGLVMSFSAFANPHAFRHVPSSILACRSARRNVDILEDSGAVEPSQPYNCPICGRDFFKRTSLVHHFKQIHESEQKKRLARLSSARGARRVSLAAKLSPKVEKFNRAAPMILTPRVGYGLAEELKRSGVRVLEVADKPEAADRELRDSMVEEMGKGRVKCFVVVSDDKGFTGVIREARARALKTVVVGDERDGVLKRYADVSFSWTEVVSGKARKEAASTVGKWRDKELLKKLEWRYEPDKQKWEESDGGDGFWSDDDNDEYQDEKIGLVGKQGDGPWWELTSKVDEFGERSVGFSRSDGIVDASMAI